MATKEFPNEWEGIPKETVADWLDHPCTRKLKAELERGKAESDRIVLAQCRAGWASTRDYEGVFLRSIARASAVNETLEQVQAFIVKGEAYVKAE